MILSTSALRLSAAAAVDLHIHTTYSDGLWSPEQLLDFLLREGYALAAITDHDRADTLLALRQLAQAKDLPLIAAVEMTTTWRGGLTDLLCYGIDLEHNALNDLALELVRRQCDNSRLVYEHLVRAGYVFPGEPDALSAVLAQPAPRQLHELVSLLKRHGYGRAQLSAGRIVLEAGGAFAAGDPAEVVAAAHRSGAVCLIAHPGRGDGFVTFDVQALDQFFQAVPLDGLEVYYPVHTPAQVAAYRAYAERHRLLVSAGSDSHGPHAPPVRYPAALCRALLERLGIMLEVAGNE